MGIFGQWRAGAAIFEEAHQVVDCVVPTVTLVHHERLQQRKRHHGAILRLVFYGSGYRYDVRETRDLREVPADLQLRVLAGLQLSVDLEEELVADPHGGVAALAGTRGHG
jgi:hypothetical protein